MAINTALSSAISGLANVNAGLALVGQNVANASTPNYVTEASTQSSVVGDGIGMGVRSGPAARVLDQQQQADLFAQNAHVSGLQQRKQALAGIDAVMGTPGQGNDLASQLGRVQTAFSALLGSPESTVQQAQVVSAAQGFARQLNVVSGAVGAARQQAQNAIASGVASLNSAIASVGAQTQAILVAKARGGSTADLENQRDVGLAQLSGLLDVRFLKQDTGNVLAVTPSGLSINFQPGAAKFATQSATLGAGSFYPASIPAITLNGIDVTAQLAGAGRLGGAIDVRDNAVPALQASLDEVAQTASARLQAQGLSLFTRADGTFPAGGAMPVQSSYLGYANEIQVNPAVLANVALVRDGTAAIVGSATGPSAFTPNPAGGPAGFSTLISRVLDFGFGDQVQAGVTQPAPNNIGLGPQGNLVGPFGAGGGLASLVAAAVSAEAQQSAIVTNTLATETAVQTTLQSSLAQSSAVSVDAQLALMVELQSAYGANARVLAAVQTMWAQLLNSVQ